MKKEAIQLVPHGESVLLIDRLLSRAEGEAVGEMVFGESGFGVWDGRVLESALVEGLAQTAAALFGAMQQTNTHQGMLVGLKGFRFPEAAPAGARVEYHIEVTRKLGAFAFVSARAQWQGRIIAEGELRLVLVEGGHG